MTFSCVNHEMWRCLIKSPRPLFPLIVPGQCVCRRPYIGAFRFHAALPIKKLLPKSHAQIKVRLFRSLTSRNKGYYFLCLTKYCSIVSSTLWVNIRIPVFSRFHWYEKYRLTRMIMIDKMRAITLGLGAGMD